MTVLQVLRLRPGGAEVVAEMDGGAPTSESVLACARSYQEIITTAQDMRALRRLEIHWLSDLPSEPGRGRHNVAAFCHPLVVRLASTMGEPPELKLRNGKYRWVRSGIYCDWWDTRVCDTVYEHVLSGGFVSVLL